jgi:hypothetical protein
MNANPNKDMEDIKEVQEEEVAARNTLPQQAGVVSIL